MVLGLFKKKKKQTNKSSTGSDQDNMYRKGGSNQDKSAKEEIVYSSQNLTYQTSLPSICQLEIKHNPLAEIEEYTTEICKDDVQLNDLIKKGQKKKQIEQKLQEQQKARLQEEMKESIRTANIDEIRQGIKQKEQNQRNGSGSKDIKISQVSQTINNKSKKTTSGIRAQSEEYRHKMQILEVPNHEEQDYLENHNSSKKQKARADKYLKLSRAHLELNKKTESHSQFATRVVQQNKHRQILNLKHGTNLMNFLKSELKDNLQHADAARIRERFNRFRHGEIYQGNRCLSQEISDPQKQKYTSMMSKSLRRERSSLSRTRFGKMKTLILKEVENVIQEADIEPTATVYQSSQNEDQTDWLVPSFSGVAIRQSCSKSFVSQLKDKAKPKLLEVDSNGPRNNRASSAEPLYPGRSVAV